MSIITPKFKKGSPSDPANYRPIALTSTCCKILERIIATELLEYLNKHNLITKHQHGFLKNHSTVTNLLESLSDWTVSFSNKRSVVIAYVDFQRAFDSITHSKLIHKLSAYGVGGNLLFWITAFLSQRTQSVRVGSSLSTPCLVSSGVPQGSVLGPLLFIVFINDITYDLPSQVKAKLFADDLKIYTELSFTNTPADFQKQLDYIFNWSITWQINISYTKCNTLEISKHPTTTKYTISTISIPSIKTIKDLGITMQNDLKFTNHISDIITRANQRAALIHRCFLSRNTTNLLRAYKTYVRPLLEYGTVIWSPSLIHLITNIESVQRRYTKRLPGLKHLTYAERLTK